MSIYNLNGEKLTTLVRKRQSAGPYQVEWDASGYGSGVYYCSLRTGAGAVQTRKLLLLK